MRKGLGVKCHYQELAGMESFIGEPVCTVQSLGEGDDAVWVALETSGGVGSISIVTSWCLD